MLRRTGCDCNCFSQSIAPPVASSPARPNTTLRRDGRKASMYPAPLLAGHILRGCCDPWLYGSIKNEKLSSNFLPNSLSMSSENAGRDPLLHQMTFSTPHFPHDTITKRLQGFEYPLVSQCGLRYTCNNRCHIR